MFLGVPVVPPLCNITAGWSLVVLTKTLLVYFFPLAIKSFQNKLTSLFLGTSTPRPLVRLYPNFNRLGIESLGETMIVL